MQAPQRGQRRDRLPRRPDRAARDGIEHPGRDLLEARDGRVHERAAHRRAGGARDDLVEANRTPRPGMPSVEDADLAARAGTMGLVVKGCTTTTGRTALSAGARPPSGSSSCRRRSSKPRSSMLPTTRARNRSAPRSCHPLPLAPNRRARWHDQRNNLQHNLQQVAAARADLGGPSGGMAGRRAQAVPVARRTSPGRRPASAGHE